MEIIKNTSLAWEQTAYYKRNNFGIIAFNIITFLMAEVKSLEFLWWINLDWLPHAHQAALSVLLPSKTTEENQIKSLWVEIRGGRLLSNYQNTEVLKVKLGR